MKTPMNKVKTNFDRLRDAESLAFSRSIIQHMTGNPFFPAPTPAIPLFTDNVDDYGVQLSAAATGDRTAVVRKNLANLLVKSNLTDLALYVNSTAKGNLEMLASSEFPLVKERSRIIITEPVITAVLQGLNAGSVQIVCGTVHGAKSYQYQCAAETETGMGPWLSEPDSRSKYEFTGLEQGRKYWFRVAAIGGFGQKVFSTEVPGFVMQRNLAA